jgi:hypothetical protein
LIDLDQFHPIRTTYLLQFPFLREAEDLDVVVGKFLCHPHYSLAGTNIYRQITPFGTIVVVL